MNWWDKVKAIARREFRAVDEALAKKERELEATPSERVDMILDEIAEEDTKIDEIESKLRDKVEARSAPVGLDSPPPAAEPNHTRIVGDLIVRALAGDESSDRMSHAVTLKGSALSTLGSTGLDAVVADMQGEVMVLDAARDGTEILLRTPTLSGATVAETVARVVARHLPELGSPPTPSDG